MKMIRIGVASTFLNDPHIRAICVGPGECDGTPVGHKGLGSLGIDTTVDIPLG